MIRMSVTDPLIKDVKGCVQAFLKEISINGKITEDNSSIIDFYQIIEKIFNTGLLIHQNTLYFNRTIDAFCWMVGTVKEKSDIISYTYVNCVENVKQRPELKNNTAKFRYLVKNCLTKKCLHVPVEFLMRTKKTHLFYLENSIIGDEILSEILLSVLLQISKFNFSLNLENISFLDVTWQLPDTLSFELVPCRALGLSVSFSSDRAVIVNIQSSGVAAETEQINIGDVLEKLNGKHVTTSSKGKLNSILRNTKSQPVHVTVVKSYQKSTKDIFPPMLQLFRDLKIDVDNVKRQYDPSGADQQLEPIKKCYGYEVLYMGYINIGEDGSVKQIEKAIKVYMSTNKAYFEDNDLTIASRINKKVLFEIGEIGVRLRDPLTTDLISQHTYMAISACGVSSSLKNYFGYVAGSRNEVCDQAVDFICYIFYSKDLEEISTILQSIGQGFHRTHFAV